jgi:hypothetical protein
MIVIVVIISIVTIIIIIIIIIMGVDQQSSWTATKAEQKEASRVKGHLHRSGQETEDQLRGCGAAEGADRRGKQGADRGEKGKCEGEEEDKWATSAVTPRSCRTSTSGGCG